MDKPQIEILEDGTFASAVADKIVTAISNILISKDSCSLCLSGGSTPKKIYRELASPLRTERVEWSKLEFFWGDERWVDKESVQSNFRMVRENLFSLLTGNELGSNSAISTAFKNVVSVDTSFSTAEEAASDYAGKIRRAGYYQMNSQNVFNIVLLGVGEDGHFASLFPDSYRDFIESDEIAISALCLADQTHRISLTPKVLLSADRVFFIVSGENKSNIVSKLFSDFSDYERFPASLALRNHENVSWLLDKSAAGKLSSDDMHI